MSSQAMELYEPGASALSLSRSPDAVLEEAGRAAKALKAVVVQTKAAIMLGASEHLKCEAWQTLGHFYGLAGRIKETRYVQFGDVQGFQAFSELVHVKSGLVISSAESMCLNDEEKWSARTKYKWFYMKKSGGTSEEDPGPGEIMWEDNPHKPGKKMPKKERVAVGEERVPLFQLMSMAETRALSKVHSNALRWVVVLAGYNPTPAEEVDGQSIIEDGNGAAPKPPVAMPQRKSDQAPHPAEQAATPATAAPKATNGEPKTITKPQQSRLWAIAYKANPGRSKEDVTTIVHDILARVGIEHTEDIKMDDYNAIIASIEGSDPEPGSNG